MKSYIKITALLLVIAMLLSLSACNFNSGDDSFYTQLSSIDETNHYDFEVSGKVYLDKIEEIKIENENQTSTDDEKKENKTTTTAYNVRLTGTYISSNEWVIKVFAKNADVKGYTNITNIYCKADDVYIDVYSMIESLDFLLEADDVVQGQFDFSKGNYIKTSLEELKNIMITERDINFKNNDLIKIMSSDFSDVFDKITYGTVALDNVLDALLTIAKEIETTLCNSNEQKEDENQSDSFTSYNNGMYTFTLDSKNKKSINFIDSFYTKVSNELDKKIKENSKDADGNEITVSAETTACANWIKNIAKSASIDEEFLFNTDITPSDSNTSIQLTYNSKNSNKQEDITFTIKLTPTSTESITLPQNISTEKTSLSDLHQDVLSKLLLYFDNKLEDEEKDLTPLKIVSIGKFVKAGQNEDYKYKVFDRYVSIAQYIGTSTNVVIPDEIEGLPVYVIETSAFENTSIQSVTMSDNIILAGERAFASCSSLNEIKISKNLEIIPESFCFECTSLSSIDIPYGIKTIQASAFGFCENLKELVIPATVSLIGQQAFSSCSGLSTIVIMDGTLFDENSVYIKTVGLYIEGGAFSGHSAKTIVVPQTVALIDSTAFNPNLNEENKIETMFYGYVPSKINVLCAENRFSFTVIANDSPIDKALKSDAKTALSIAKGF